MQNITPAEVEVQASLFIYDGDPDEITKTIGIQPSSAHRKGEVFRLAPNQNDSPMCYKSHVWALDSPLSKTTDVEKHLEWLLKQLRPHKAQVKEVADKYHAMVTFTCHYYDCQQGFRLENDAVKELADLGLTFDFDVYNMSMDYLENESQLAELQRRLNLLPTIKKLSDSDHDEAFAIASALAIFEDESGWVRNGISDLFFWDEYEEDELTNELQRVKEKLDKINEGLAKSRYLQARDKMKKL